MQFPFGETVTILTAAVAVDPYSGVSAPDWDLEPADANEVPGVAIAPGGSAEPLQDARNSVEADYDLYFPAGTEITRENRVIVRGVTCEVVGKPALWRSPFTGWTPGLVVQAKFQEG